MYYLRANLTVALMKCWLSIYFCSFDNKKLLNPENVADILLRKVEPSIQGLYTLEVKIEIKLTNLPVCSDLSSSVVCVFFY